MDDETCPVPTNSFVPPMRNGDLSAGNSSVVVVAQTCEGQAQPTLRLSEQHMESWLESPAPAAAARGGSLRRQISRRTSTTLGAKRMTEESFDEREGSGRAVSPWGKACLSVALRSIMSHRQAAKVHEAGTALVIRAADSAAGRSISPSAPRSCVCLCAGGGVCRRAGRWR